MSKSIANIEFNLKEIFETYFTNRPVRYSNERISQPEIPYVVLKFLSQSRIGIPYKKYFPGDPEDLEEVNVTPSEIVFTVLFIGGNARGELSYFLNSFWLQENIDVLSDKGICYLDNSSIIDTSAVLGGDAEQRAQTDITFSANIVVDSGIITTIEEVIVNQKLKNYNNQEVVDFDIIIKE
jgi:hypothetical protein